MAESASWAWGAAGGGARRPAPPAHATASARERGLTLIELVITITVLSVLTLGVIPLVRTSVRRQKEARLRETLREIRLAIDEFKRDTANPPGLLICPPPPGVNAQPWVDPRSKVFISDCTIFKVDNPDRYPPDWESLTQGVAIIPRVNLLAGAGGGGAPVVSTQKKVYLREIPVDPITGERDWCLRSSYDAPGDDCSSSTVNIFDVRSKAGGEALNGEKYSEW